MKKAFLIILIILFAPASMEASIDYKSRYKYKAPALKGKQLKPIRKIIREILNKRRIKPKQEYYLAPPVIGNENLNRLA